MAYCFFFLEITLTFSFSGNSAATTGEMALRERFHLHDVVSPRSHKLGQHWERETLFILVRDWHFCYMDFSLFSRSNKSGLCLRITESRFRYIFCWSAPDEMVFFRLFLDFCARLWCCLYLLLLYTGCFIIFSHTLTVHQNCDWAKNSRINPRPYL